MNEHDIAELSYKNGYDQGYKDGQQSTIKRGQWLINCDGYYPYCSECKTEPISGIMTDYCPTCGAYMKKEVGK